MAVSEEVREAVMIGYLHGFSSGRAVQPVSLEQAVSATYNVMKYSPFVGSQFPDITIEKVKLVLEALGLKEETA